MDNTNFSFEVKRKFFHLSALLLPLCYFFVSKLIMVTVLFAITVCVLYIDISRQNNFKIKEFIDRIFVPIMRLEEATGAARLSGMSFMMLGFFLTSVLFPKGLAICSWCILIISDCLAALVGSRMSEKLDNGKSLAGSVAFFSSAIFIGILVYFVVDYHTSFAIIIVSSLVTTMAEFYSKQLRINDNLLIPLTYCCSTVIFNILL